MMTWERNDNQFTCTWIYNYFLLQLTEYMCVLLISCSSNLGVDFILYSFIKNFVLIQ